jgi:predicted ArsR family transcriptional regulator
MDRLGDAAGSLGALQDEVRRKLYLFVRGARRPVGRDEAAEAAGISRKLAAFHLDKLVNKGLLEAHYARLPGRSGPGAGRSSKLYQPSDIEVDASIPERRYDFVGDILVDALNTRSPDESPVDAARRAARETGTHLGQEVKAKLSLRPPGAERALSVACEVLEDHGYEPFREGHDSVALSNCPFHALQQRSPELICGVNQAFIDGMLRGLGNSNVEAVLDPQPGRCCVVLQAPQ